jgi:hypothetical protein
MRNRSAGFVFAVSMLLAAGCTEDGTGPGGPSWFRATLDGAVTGQYEGRGEWGPERTEQGAPWYLTIASQEETDGVEQSFVLRWPGRGRPQAGTYSLVHFDDAAGSPHGPVALYRYQAGDNVSQVAMVDTYVGLAGTVEITRSTDDVVEGTVQFSGAQVYRSVGADVLRNDPRGQPDPAAPRIQVSGSFRVTRWADEGEGRNGG